MNDVDRKTIFRGAARRATVVFCVVFASVMEAHGVAAAGEVVGTVWPAIDALGRRLPVEGEVKAPRADRSVGIFYFLWLAGWQNRSPHWDGPYDVSQILTVDPDALAKPESALWGPLGMPHYWGQSIYGYYRSDDAWVLRRHAHLLADAGIDTLVFDTTNAETYPAIYTKLCDVFTQIRREGDATPRIAFMVNTQPGKTAQKLYQDLYAPGRYRELWYLWQGKPLLICDPQEATPEVREFFTLRRAHWPFEMINTPYAWHWEATYPQPYGFAEKADTAEQLSVSVAQNLRAADGRVTNMSRLDARGRSFHDKREDTTAGAVLHGYNFQEQWQRAFDLDPPFVLVTGWNEWIAGRFSQPNEPIAFVDQFNQEFSRDIEPMRGGHGDNYYYQLVANVRRYKGVAAFAKPSPPKSIRIASGFDQWQDVGPEYKDHLHETDPRDHDGNGGLHYINRTGRNDLVVLKVARDAENTYFHARTREPISPATDPNWMWLLLDTDQDRATGWEGFDYIVNRQIEGNTSWLEHNTGGWNWQRVAPVEMRAAGHDLHLAVPRALLWQQGQRQAFDFKWADHLQRPGEVSDFYVSGDVAPEGRFAYRYVAE